MTPKQPTGSIDVAVGLIRNNDGAWLCCQRGVTEDHAGLWEFPGGKFEPGEDLEQALIRELEEELGWSTVDRVSIAQYVDFTWEHPGKRVHLHCGLIELDSSPNCRLQVHQAVEWLRVEDMGNKEWLASNLTIINSLRADFR